MTLLVNGDSFLTGYYFNAGKLYAIYDENPWRSSRSCQYALQVKGVTVSDYATLTQTACEAPGGCEGTLEFFDNFYCDGGNNLPVGTFNLGEHCTGELTVLTIGEPFVTRFSTEANGTIIVDCGKNYESTSRSCQYALQINGVTVTNVATLTQLACESPTCTCQADTTVSVNITQTNIDGDGERNISIGTFSTTCNTCDWGLLGYDRSVGEYWYSISFEPLGDQARSGIIYISAEELPDGIDSRTASFSITYNNEEVGGTIRITQTRS